MDNSKTLFTSGKQTNTKNIVNYDIKKKEIKTDNKNNGITSNNKDEILQFYDLEENDTKSIKSCRLDDTDKKVQETIIMRLTEKEAIEYLNEHGFPMSRAKYFRHKRKLEETTLQRLYTVVKYGFSKQHLEKIEKLEMIEKQMWKDYFDCKDPYKRVEILIQIANLQPILTAFYDSTRYALEKQYPNIEFNMHNKEDSI